MRKFVSVMMALVMMLSLAACQSGGEKETTGAPVETTEAPVETTEAPVETTVPVAAVASAVEILENIWANYAEEEKFAIIGGNPEAMYMDGPGNWDMAYAEGMSYNLLVPADSLASVDEAASMIHMMNANTFTCGVLHLVEGTDVTAFAAAMREAVQGNQWMCGFPETLVIAVIGGEYVLVAFGVNDAMTPFQTHLAEAYADAEILYNEAIAG